MTRFRPTLALLFQLLLVVNVTNMPAHRRGTAVALLAAVLGMSASVFTALYNGPLNSSVDGVLFVMGITMLVACVVTALMARRIDPADTWDAEAAGAVMLSHHGSFLVPHPIDAQGSGADSTAYKPMTDGLDEEMMYGTKGLAVNNGKPPLSLPTLSPSDSFVSPLVEPYFESEEERLAYEAGRNERAQLAYQASVLGGGMAGQVFGAVGFLMRQKPYWIMAIIFVLMVGVSHK